MTRTVLVSVVALLCAECAPGAEANDDACRYHNDGKCDEPQYCIAGTDCTDCGNCLKKSGTKTCPIPGRAVDEADARTLDSCSSDWSSHRTQFPDPSDFCAARCLATTGCTSFWAYFADDRLYPGRCCLKSNWDGQSTASSAIASEVGQGEFCTVQVHTCPIPGRAVDDANARALGVSSCTSDWSSYRTQFPDPSDFCAARCLATTGCTSFWAYFADDRLYPGRCCLKSNWDGQSTASSAIASEVGQGEFCTVPDRGGH